MTTGVPPRPHLPPAAPPVAGDDPFDLVVRAPRAIVGDDERGVELGIRDGTIASVEPLGAALRGRDVRELTPDEVLLPGLVDSHVHVCEPGNEEWEGFDHATRAAAAGGVTTIVDMPIDSVPPIVDVAGLEAVRAAAARSARIDVAFWGGVIPGNEDDLEPLIEAGVCGFKAFLADTGDPLFPGIGTEELTAALRRLAPHAIPLLVHAESAAEAARHPVPAGRSYAAYLAARPRSIENAAIEAVIEAVRETGGRAHVVHLSSADGVEMLARARDEGLPITVETCPHYLVNAAEEIADGATGFKCSPPIREAANRDVLWDGLRAGVIDRVVSDHSPSTVEMKHLNDGDFGAAWGGISSLQLSLPLVWTEAARRGFPLSTVVAWMATNTASLAGLRSKGAIEVGRDADLLVLGADDAFVVEPRRLEHRHPVTPYGGRRLAGVVRSTILRGTGVDPEHARGRLLVRDDATSRADAGRASRPAGALATPTP